MKEKKTGILFLFDRRPDESDTFFDSVPLPGIHFIFISAIKK